MKQIRILTILSLALGFTAAFAEAKGRADEELFVHDPAGIHREWLRTLPEVTIDHPTREGYEVYGPPSLVSALTTQGVDFWNIRMDTKAAAGGYPAFTQVEARLKDLAARFPQIMRLSSVGKSVQGRDLWVMKISKSPDQDLLLPEVKYISSMHGNEITGRELMLNFIEEIGTRYPQDARVQRLVNNTEIYIMPSMNPDGSELRQRGNARNVDLNRDFPDFSTSDNQNVTTGRAVETQAIMNFQASRQFALSANFHGGSEVVNYPWDTVADPHPFDALVKDLSRGYADLVPYLRSSQEFEHGITNGYAWYEVDGGMQDWSYNWYNDLQVTVELSNAKWPNFSEIPRFYNDNREALFFYLESAARGAGFVLDQTGKNGNVKIEEIGANGSLTDRGTYNFRNSEFYKILPNGRYRFTVNVPGVTTRLDFEADVNGQFLANGNYQRLRL